MKVYFGRGLYLEPDKEPRRTQFHKRIVKFKPIPNTRNGNWIYLECGHLAMAFGRLEHGALLCAVCRDEEQVMNES